MPNLHSVASASIKLLLRPHLHRVNQFDNPPCRNAQITGLGTCRLQDGLQLIRENLDLLS